jgi:hypothetical protein
MVPSVKMEFGELGLIWNSKLYIRTLILYQILKLEDWSGLNGGS